MKAWINEETGKIVYVESELEGAWKPVEEKPASAEEKPSTKKVKK